jgi:Raf kinase inhibitor-like YbhB/YbcL family protein
MARRALPALLALAAAVGLTSREGSAMALALTSTAFKAGETIPQKYTCDGQDVSPPLAWTDPPAATRGFALVCDDPDAPSGTFVHWVLWGLPAAARSLPEGVPPTPTVEDGGRQGRNDFKRTGYGGPCPPPGAPHRYFFRLYALDATVDLAPVATKADLLKAIEGHTVGQAELMGRYARR